jgi:hypothetical protein
VRRRRDRAWLLGPVVVLAAAALVTALAQGARPRDDGPSPCAGTVDLVNGGFEEPTTSAFTIVDQSKVPGWRTTEPDGKIELWASGYLGVPSAVGRQFAELSANQQGELYQDRATEPGAVLSYAFYHRGRAGVDTMALEIGSPGGPPTLRRPVSSGKDAWHLVTGEYVVPAGQTVTRFGFEAVQNASGNPSIGNFLDDVTFTLARCTVRVAKALVPASDPGRFDLLVDGRVVAADVGGGGGSGPVGTPRDAVTVSERAIGGGTLGSYASAVVCRDAASGEVLTRAEGSEATVRLDRRRDVACTIANARAPAVVLKKALMPEGDAGAFDLLVNGEVVVPRAGDDALAGPTVVPVGPVTVAERPAAGTDPDDYGSAVLCRDRGGLGEVVAGERGTSATFVAQPGTIVGCVLLNVRRTAPAPPPAPPAPPAPGPTPAAADNLDLVTRAVALQAAVAHGGTARFRVRVLNRGPLAATDVRVVPFVRRAGRPPRALALSAGRSGGVCAVIRGVGACQVRRIPPGGSVAIAVAASTDGRRPGARLLATQRVRLVAVARAAEPERLASNNVAAASTPLVGGLRGLPPVTG